MSKEDKFINVKNKTARLINEVYARQNNIKLKKIKRTPTSLI
jgi:hypothetical protein